MADRAQLVGMALTALIILSIGHVVITAALTPDVKAYANAADDYCKQELGPNASLFNARVFGSHGGLHCEGPNGATIHLHDVPREDVMAAANNSTGTA